jgi:inhibitor of cysteine peptidase
MKKKLILIIAMTVILLITGASFQALANNNSDETNVKVTIDELMEQKHIEKEVGITVASTLKVSLGSNATTGFRWTEQAQIDNQNILKQTEHQFIGPKTNIPGGAGNEEWKFEATNKGTTTVTMEYSQPWDGGLKSEWTLILTVNVK